MNFSRSDRSLRIKVLPLKPGYFFFTQSRNFAPFEPLSPPSESLSREGLVISLAYPTPKIWYRNQAGVGMGPKRREEKKKGKKKGKKKKKDNNPFPAYCAFPTAAKS